jgi:uncharacterized protein YndB with AHSA1/START domain
MTDIRITRQYPHPQTTVWQALTDPELVPRWTSTGRGGRPEGFSTEVGTHFRFLGKPVPGWRGTVDCEVLEAQEPSLLRYSWVGEENGRPTFVTYRLEQLPEGTRFMFEHTGFTGMVGFIMARLVLGPVRRKMLDVGLPSLLDAMAQDSIPRHGDPRSEA